MNYRSFFARMLISMLIMAPIKLICPVNSLVKESFLAEPNPIRKNREKKYSELYDELLESYEQLLRRQSEVIRAITHAQEDCMDEIRRLAQNMPKAPRKRLINELKRINKILESSESCIFF